MKFHIGILGHGRADTSTFKSVQLVPAHVDNMFLDIKCFDHRNAVFKKKKPPKRVKGSGDAPLQPIGTCTTWGRKKAADSSWPSQHGQRAAAPAAEALY